MKLRNWTAGIAILCFAFGVFFLHQGAAGAEVDQKNAAINQESAGGGEQYAISLEQAIQIAREAFEVPGELDQFSTGFSQSDQDSFWELRWYRISAQGGEMSVRVNAGTGEIWSMYKWLPQVSGVEYRGLPRYTREQAEAIAAATAQKLQPERFRETSLQPGRDYIPLLSVKERGQVEYNFYYARHVDGAIYSDNGISVAVNGDTGKVIRFDLNWGDTRDFPPQAGRISRERAEQLFHSESAPELHYFRPSLPYGAEAPVKLVYKLPESRRQVIIDALTGELLNNEMNYYFYDKLYSSLAGGGAKDDNSLTRQEIKLNPAEEIQVDKLKDLIPKDEALKIAKSAVTIPLNYVLTNSRLEQDYLFKENKTWNFGWQAGDGSNYGGMDVSIDAVNGDLVAFSRYYNSYEDFKTPVVKYSDEEARRIAEDYIKKKQPGRWAQVVFGSLQPVPGPVINPLEEPQPRSYAIYYTRVANGVKFPQNGFCLEVNSATGEINSYRMTWWDVKFPEPAGVISRDAAADKYLQEAPLTLGYLRLWAQEKYWKPRQEGKVHLVYYQPDLNFAMLDAFTGRKLDGEGNIIASSGGKDSFSDLEGHPAREAVELLAGAGIVAGVDGRFRPDEPVTQAELIAMLVKSFGRSPAAAVDGNKTWYQSYYDTAVLLGIIRAGEKPDPDVPVNRETLARLTVHAMGLYNVARYSSIYVLDFQDAGDISEHLRGHAALSVALGLIEPVEGEFEPKAVVTRAEAAETIVRLLKNSK